MVTNKIHNLDKVLKDIKSSGKLPSSLTITGTIAHSGYVNDNYRFYNPDYADIAIKNMIQDDEAGRAATPVMINHNSKDVTSVIGRVLDGYHEKVQYKTKTGGKNMPVGAMVAKMKITNKKAIQSILDKEWQSFSTSLKRSPIICSICGKDMSRQENMTKHIFPGMAMHEHIPGQGYGKGGSKLCYQVFDQYEYSEVSMVGIPGDAYSRLVGVETSDSLIIPEYRIIDYLNFSHIPAEINTWDFEDIIDGETVVNDSNDESEIFTINSTIIHPYLETVEDVNDNLQTNNIQSMEDNMSDEITIKALQETIAAKDNLIKELTSARDSLKSANDELTSQIETLTNEKATIAAEREAEKNSFAKDKASFESIQDKAKGILIDELSRLSTEIKSPITVEDINAYKENDINTLDKIVDYTRKLATKMGTTIPKTDAGTEDAANNTNPEPNPAENATNDSTNHNNFRPVRKM